MARATSNKIIENLDNNAKRVSDFNGPAVESETARIRTVGTFRQDNVAASQSGVALKVNAVDANAPTGVVAARAGKIIGMTWQLSAAITAGVATLQATIGGTGTGDAESIVSAATTAAVADQSSEIAFAEGAVLGVKITTDGSASPTTSELYVDLIVRFDP